MALSCFSPPQGYEEKTPLNSC